MKGMQFMPEGGDARTVVVYLFCTSIQRFERFWRV